MSRNPQSSPQPPPSPAFRTVPLKGALKNSSRPSTPAPTSPPFSPPLPSVSLPGSSPSIPFSRTSTGYSNPSGYKPKVGFDTFEGPNDVALFSFTLQVKSDEYRKSRTTRVYLCASSPDESGKRALDWVLSSLVQDGDELVVMRGFDSDELVKEMHEEVRDQAKELMRKIQERNTEIQEGRKLSIIVEFVAGRVTDTIERMIALYRPDSLIVGTRGQTGILQSWGAAFGGMGSVSKYCLSHSPVPVIVVQPDHQVQRAMEKRRADPKRKAQYEELTKSASSIPLSP